MSTTIARKLVTAGLLSLCAAGLTVQAQTASPGPPSRNANVDKEDPNKPDTPEHEIPNQEAPGSGINNDRGAAGETTPTGGDGSVVTEPHDPTQPIPRNSAEQNAVNADKDQNTSQEAQSASDRNGSNTSQGDGTQNGDANRNESNADENDRDQDDDTGDEQGASTSTQSDNGQQQPAKQTPPDPQR